MRAALILFLFSSLAWGVARSWISIRWPARRLWPPPEDETRIQAVLGRVSGWGTSLAIPVLGVVDFDRFILVHPSRFVLAASLFTLGFIAFRAHRQLGTGPSVARPREGEELTLLVDGSYSATRNPQYVFAIPCFLGVAIAANSGLALLAWILQTLSFVLTPRPEEAWLSERFGQAYRDYCDRVPRFFPEAWRPALMIGCLVVLPLDFVVTSLSFVTPTSYDWQSQFMSELAVLGQPGHGLLTVWWFLYGGAFLLLASLCASDRRWGRPALAFAGALALTGLGLGIIPAIYPCDMGCAALTGSGQVHQIAGIAGMLALSLAPLLLAASFRRLPEWRWALALGVVAGIGSAVSWTFQILAGTPDTWWFEHRGLLQRLGLAWSYACLAVLVLYWVRSKPAGHLPPSR